ncbi:MAG: hypothetical protein IKZ86_09085 [Spirochaetaceae bacterium]|nr:hypothetical protein [Spirochaetaceae bacterium]
MLRKTCGLVHIAQYSWAVHTPPYKSKKGLYNFAINLPLGIGTWVQKNIGDGQGKLDKSGEYKQAPSDWWKKAIKSVGLPDQ